MKAQSINASDINLAGCSRVHRRQRLRRQGEPLRDRRQSTGRSSCRKGELREWNTNKKRLGCWQKRGGNGWACEGYVTGLHFDDWEGIWSYQSFFWLWNILEPSQNEQLSLQSSWEDLWWETWLNPGKTEVDNHISLHLSVHISFLCMHIHFNGHGSLSFLLSLSLSIYIYVYWLLRIVSFACSSIHTCDYSLYMSRYFYQSIHTYESSSFQTWRSLHLQGRFKSWEAWLCCRSQRRSRHPMARGMQATKGWCNCCKGTGFSQLRLKWDSLRWSKGGHIFRMSLKDEGQRLVAWFAKWWISNNVNASTSLVSCRLSEHFSTLLFSHLLCTDWFSDWDY